MSEQMKYVLYACIAALMASVWVMYPITFPLTLALLGVYPLGVVVCYIMHRWMY